MSFVLITLGIVGNEEDVQLYVRCMVSDLILLQYLKYWDLRLAVLTEKIYQATNNLRKNVNIFQGKQEIFFDNLLFLKGNLHAIKQNFQLTIVYLLTWSLYITKFDVSNGNRSLQSFNFTKQRLLFSFKVLYCWE